MLIIAYHTIIFNDTTGLSAVETHLCCILRLHHLSCAACQVAFLPNGNAVLSASLDGTVRAFDLLRCGPKVNSML